ncbi:hypothetical protein VCV18_001944 [Metarhizium anisopliae]
MQGIGEWRTRCSAALPHVLTSEAPDALLNALHRHEDDGRRAEMLKAAGSKADGNAGHYGRSRSPGRLAMRFTYAIQQIQAVILSPDFPDSASLVAVEVLPRERK